MLDSLFKVTHLFQAGAFKNEILYIILVTYEDEKAKNKAIEEIRGKST